MIAYHAIVTRSLLIVGFFLIFLGLPQVLADKYNPVVLPVDSNPYGHSYGEWSAKFWQWMLPIPTSENPLNDKDGSKCAVNQSGQVWFLPGFNGGPVARTCMLPSGKSLVFAALTSECSYAEFPSLKSESDLRTCAINQDQGGVPQVTLDGVSFNNYDNYRVQSPLFNFTYPKDNIFGAPAGNTQAVSDGWFFVLSPLQPGKHTLHFGGVVIGNPSTGTQAFSLDVTYHLFVG